MTDQTTEATTDLVARIRARQNDAPMPTERLLDEAADEIERLRGVMKSAMAETDAFEQSANRAFHVGLARNCLAAVPDSYTDDQLDNIGRRAIHWVLKALREH
jgi:hypothetical protein